MEFVGGVFASLFIAQIFPGARARPPLLFTFVDFPWWLFVSLA